MLQLISGKGYSLDILGSFTVKLFISHCHGYILESRSQSSYLFPTDTATTTVDKVSDTINATNLLDLSDKIGRGEILFTVNK